MPTDELEDVSRQVPGRERGRGCLAEATLDAPGRYASQMRGLAWRMGFGEPCQEPCDAFVADDRGSAERRSMHVHASKLVDAVAGTRAVSPSGLFHDEPDMPSMEEANAAFARSGLPAEGVDVLIAATKADAVIAGLGLTRPAMGQYRHAWRELAAYLQAKNGSTLLKSDYFSPP